MKILVVNDDGIQDRGLWALAEALEPMGEVRVYSPDRNYSGAGMSVALTPEFHLQRAGPPDGIHTNVSPHSRRTLRRPTWRHWDAPSDSIASRTSSCRASIPAGTRACRAM